MRDPVERVLDRRGEVVRRPPVRAQDHDVLDRLVRHLDAAEDDVVPGGRALVRHAEPDRALVLVGLALVEQPAGLAPERARSGRAGTSPGRPSRGPSQRSDSWICSVASATSRPVSVFSIRRRNSPPWCRANSQLKSAVRTFPMWRKPVGLGAMRTRTGADIGHYRRRMLLGAHCSGGVKGALDRAVEIGADAVQLFTQSPRTWRVPAPDPEVYERFRDRRRETGIGAVLCHARLPGQPGGAGRHGLREVGRRRWRARSTSPARSRPTESSSTSARTWVRGSTWASSGSRRRCAPRSIAARTPPGC